MLEWEFLGWEALLSRASDAFLCERSGPTPPLYNAVQLVAMLLTKTLQTSFVRQYRLCDPQRQDLVRLDSAFHHTLLGPDLGELHNETDVVRNNRRFVLALGGDFEYLRKTLGVLHSIAQTSFEAAVREVLEIVAEFLQQFGDLNVLVVNVLFEQNNFADQLEGFWFPRAGSPPWREPDREY